MNEYNYLEQLEKLANLKEKGAITEEEFQKEKQKLLKLNKEELPSESSEKKKQPNFGSFIWKSIRYLIGYYFLVFAIVVTATLNLLVGIGLIVCSFLIIPHTRRLLPGKLAKNGFITFVAFVALFILMPQIFGLEDERYKEAIQDKDVEWIMAHTELPSSISENDVFEILSEKQKKEWQKLRKEQELEKKKLEKRSKELAQIEKCKKAKIDASILSQEYAKSRLKAPSSAKFPFLDPDSIGLEYKGGVCKYSIQSYVDAQNGFGAMIRKNYYIKLARKENDKWSLLEIRMN